MFKVISDMKAHCYDMWNTIITAINFCNAKKLNCALMLITSNHYGILCVSNLLQIEPCNEMFKVISDMVHCYDMWSTIINAIRNGKKMCALMFIMSNHYGRKCVNNLLQLEPWNDMFIVISDMMAHCYDMWNTIIKAINFCNGKKINSALMFNMSNHNGRKCLSSLL